MLIHRVLATVVAVACFALKIGHFVKFGHHVLVARFPRDSLGKEESCGVYYPEMFEDDVE